VYRHRHDVVRFRRRTIPYDSVRARAGRPIAGGRDIIQLYWVACLAMFVLATTSAVAAIVR
jgi:hypothetical protein